MRLVAMLLSPLSLLVAQVARSRRRRIDAARRETVAKGWAAVVSGAAPDRPVPVVVVGNLVVGGTGKTPLLIALVEALRARGFRPAVIARGYRSSRGASGAGLADTGRQDPQRARRVGPGDDASIVGDEPLLIARRTGCPVAVGVDRAAALALVLATSDCDVVLSDDGLQHVGLRRDIELAVFDGRGAGNGRCLPAGPLREPLEALASVDAVVLNGQAATSLALPHPLPHPRTFRFDVRPGSFRTLDGERQWSPADFAADPSHGDAPPTAIAGIGAPERFFEMLAALGLDGRRIALPDHARIDPQWLATLPGRWLVMTEKDAVKCDGFAEALRSRCVALRIDAVPEAALLDWLEGRLRGQPTA
jgi:tetraacyldisaccharide 4'-kinase